VVVIPIYLSVEEKNSLYLQDKIFLFQVSAVTSNGLCIPIFFGGNSCPCELLQKEAQHFLSSNIWEEIHGKILKIFLWRYGISIVLTGMIHGSNGHNTIPN
jgi:hypothetical protein